MSKKKDKNFISTYENPKDNKFYVAEYSKLSELEWSLIGIKDHIRGVENKDDAVLRAINFADSQNLSFINCDDDILVDKIVEETANKVFEMAINNPDIDDFLEILASDVLKTAEVKFSSGHVCHVSKNSNGTSSWLYTYPSDFSNNPYHLLKALIHLLAIEKASVTVKSPLEELHNNGKPLTEIRGWTFIYDNEDLVVQQAKSEELFININTVNGQMVLPDAELIYCDEDGTRYNPLLS